MIQGGPSVLARPTIALVLGAVEELEGALDLDLGRGGHRADVPGIAGKRARLGRRGLRLLLQDRLVVLQEVGGVLLGRGGRLVHRLRVAAAAKAAEERPPRLVARDAARHVARGGLADPAVVLRPREAELADGIALAARCQERLGSPFRMVRPQTSQATFSSTGRSPFSRPSMIGPG